MFEWRRGTLVVLAVPMAGCFSFGGTCETPPEVVAQQEIPGIVVPEGLDPLDPNRALDIPVATAPPRDGDDCLDKPPRIEEGG
ncbi:MAG: hypothetical protein AAGH76_16260 [Pseudomonadota bacterium]